MKMFTGAPLLAGRIDEEHAHGSYPAELRAIWEALRWTPAACPLTIRSESESAIKAIDAWRAGDDIQVWLEVTIGKRRSGVARLCFNPHHQDDLHWHWPSKPGGSEPRRSVLHPPATIDHDTMIYDVFLPELHITNFQRVRPT